LARPEMSSMSRLKPTKGNTRALYILRRPSYWSPA
jgi:hypothetical protein